MVSQTVFGGGVGRRRHVRFRQSARDDWLAISQPPYPARRA
ncbi:hypothetical protein [Acetobacter sp. DsW_063]|nr:hypothetical protein [Acetobacter sp. DsW_063]